jgi:integrase
MATRKRRGRGEGGIYQRGDGPWCASLSLGYDGNGKRKRRTVYGDTKQEVQEKLRKLQADAAGGMLCEVRQVTVRQYLERWLKSVKPTVQPNTFDPYQRHCNRHIIPKLGNHKMGQLAPVHVEGLYKDLMADGVSAALTRKVGTTLTIALGEAVRLKVIPYNPAADIRKPKAEKPEMQVLDPDQVAVFLAEAEKERLYALYVTALDSGMRPGELFALQWPDIDFNSGHMTVTKSLEEIAGRLWVKEVKTKKGRRRIDLSPFTVAALHEHCKRMLAEGLAAGPVFCNSIGTYLRRNDVRDHSFKPTLKRAKLPDIRLYDLRHTCATLLLLAGENPKVVSERLGHATVTLTLDTYSHVLPTMQKQAAAKLGRIPGQKPVQSAIG